MVCSIAIDEDNKGCDYLNQAVQANYSGEGSLTVYTDSAGILLKN